MFNLAQENTKPQEDNEFRWGEAVVFYIPAELNRDIKCLRNRLEVTGIRIKFPIH